MRVYVVIPAYNEEDHLPQTLDSLVAQSHQPEKIVVVDDQSTDKTGEIIARYSRQYSFISGVRSPVKGKHEPGSKVVRAFNLGLDSLDDSFDLICKFDADLVFQADYLEKIVATFSASPDCGMAGGFCAIRRNGQWVLETLTARDHIRGALKCYRKECFKDIGGLKPAMGWDTADEMLARYHSWKVITNPELVVKHLKPTAELYQKTQAARQGMVFRNLRYGLLLTVLAALKLAIKKRSARFFASCISGYAKAGGPYLLNKKEGAFLRSYRWKNLGKN